MLVMKRMPVWSAALAAALASSVLSPFTLAAQAADQAPVFKALPSQPAYSWTGFYGGLNAGYSGGNVPFDQMWASVPATSGTLDPGGFLGGAQFGYNYQTGPLLLGIEADIAWRAGKDETFGTLSNNDLTAFRTGPGWIGTLRPRVGVATDNWLVYATGGLAYGTNRPQYSETRPGVDVTRSASESGARAGWTVGAGVEYAPSKRWSLGLEYLYADLGKTTVTQPAQDIGGAAFGPSSTTFHDQSHMLRGKLNYKFDW
jgi:outer membrane immunogenic protein